MDKPSVFLQEMGNRISAVRKSRGLTQEQAAEAANVSVGVISTAERGTKALRPENIVKISAALGVSCDYLLRGIVTDRELVDLLRRLNELDETQKNVLYNVLTAGIDSLK